MEKKTEEKIEKIIEESGNTFHFEVVDFLRKRDWRVLVSPYYTDSISNKSREVDIVAEKEFFIEGIWEEKIGLLGVRFFIECKYIINETIFWFDKKDIERAIEKLINNTLLKPPTENIAIEKHRYLKKEDVAKMFSSSPNKLPENEPIYRALNQSLNSMISYTDINPATKPPRKRLEVKETIDYPLILCNNFDKFYKPDKSKINDNFQLEINYAYKYNDEDLYDYFLVEIVDFSKFDNFLENLEKTDIEAFRMAIS